jgi:hypothetical protein
MSAYWRDLAPLIALFITLAFMQATVVLTNAVRKHDYRLFEDLSQEKFAQLFPIPSAQCSQAEVRRKAFSPLLVTAHEFANAQQTIYHNAVALVDDVLTPKGELGFFQRNNPVVRHVVLRKRATLERLGLLPRIPIDIHPLAGQHMPALFDGLGLRTSSAFSVAYEAAESFTRALRKRKKSAGFMRSLMLQRICSSYASGLATAQKLLAGLTLDDEELELKLEVEGVDLIDEERQHLQTIIDVLSPHPTDPKLDAVLYFLEDRKWLEKGCIVFSQYFDTTKWAGDRLTERMPKELVAVYAGAGKSGLFIGGEWKSVKREQIKKAVQDRTIRLVVATDAACEGLNLQTLGTLINIDLPWNPSRLEQRIGRIKRFGQRRDRVDMLNLVYHGSEKPTLDEKIYEKLSARMKDRYDIFGTLPDVIEDDWIDDEEKLACTRFG